MSLVLFLLAALAGGLGAVARWVVEVVAARHASDGFPWGLLVVNISGSFALGLVTGSLSGTAAAFIIGTGFLGGYTTFSSVSAATALLLDEHRTRAALMNAGATFAFSVLAAFVGIAVGRLFA